jgi:hypothetical protein
MFAPILFAKSTNSMPEALQVAAKCYMLKSISLSQHSIGKEVVN